MVQPHAPDRQPAVQREATPSWPVLNRALTAARERYEGSLAQGFVIRLKAIGFTDQVMLFGAGLLVKITSTARIRRDLPSILGRSLLGRDTQPDAPPGASVRCW